MLDSMSQHGLGVGAQVIHSGLHSSTGVSSFYSKAYLVCFYVTLHLLVPAILLDKCSETYLHRKPLDCLLLDTTALHILVTRLGRDIVKEWRPLADPLHRLTGSHPLALAVFSLIPATIVSNRTPMLN